MRVAASQTYSKKRVFAMSQDMRNGRAVRLRREQDKSSTVCVVRFFANCGYINH